MQTVSIPYILTSNAITVYVGGKVYSFDRSEALDLIQLLRDGSDELTVLAHCDRLLAARHLIARAVATSGVSHRVTFDNDELRVDGIPVQAPVLVEKLVDILKVGLPIDPWLRLVERIWANPQTWARDEFLLWLETSNLPITPDGNFLAYKKVRNDYRDIHSGTLDYSVGQVVQMDRENVDTDRNNTCSRGLHFCSADYLPQFASYMGAADRVLIVEVDPADVVSIPKDYSNTKGRAWKLKVVAEVDAADISTRKWAPVDNLAIAGDDVDEDSLGDKDYF